MFLTFEPDLDNVWMNQHVEYLGQRSFSSTVIVQSHRHTTHTGLITLRGPLKCSVKSLTLEVDAKPSDEEMHHVKRPLVVIAVYIAVCIVCCY